MAVIDIPEKLANTAAQWRILGSTRQFSLLLTLAFGLMLVICSVDKSTISTLLQASTYPQQHKTLKIETPKNPPESNSSTSSPIPDPVVPNWVTAELERNYTTKLYAHWLEPGGSICRDSQTHDIRIPRFDPNPNPEPISLPAGDMHEIFFQALDENGTSRCLGGDFFEIDLSGENWKSRPPMTDYGNGTYSFTLQVHPDFSGEYNLTIILLFRHYEGLKFSPSRFVLDKQLRKTPILFTRPGSGPELPPLPTCKRSHFNRTLWSGRWTATPATTAARSPTTAVTGANRRTTRARTRGAPGRSGHWRVTGGFTRPIAGSSCFPGAKHGNVSTASGYSGGEIRTTSTPYGTSSSSFSASRISKS